jgi:hypothetical protein
VGRDDKFLKKSHGCISANQRGRYTNNKKYAPNDCESDAQLRSNVYTLFLLLSMRAEATNSMQPGTTVWARMRKNVGGEGNAAGTLSHWWPARVAYPKEVENSHLEPETGLHRYVPVIFFGEDGDCTTLSKLIYGCVYHC